MTGTLSDAAQDRIRASMDDATADPRQIPGCVAVVVDRDGTTLFAHASGAKGVDTAEPMTLDTVFWIASCTKMVAGVAAMQLVERGRLALDDADVVERYCPELGTVQILRGVDGDGRAETVAKENRITLRMLLSHTGMALDNLCTVFCFGLTGSTAGFDDAAMRSWNVSSTAV